LAELGSGITVSILSHLAKRLSRGIPKNWREVTSAKDAEFSKRDDIWSQSSPAACARSIRHPGEWVKGRGITWTERRKERGRRRRARKSYLDPESDKRRNGRKNGKKRSENRRQDFLR